VPAAAVIPAPVVYIKFVAFKKLVVGLRFSAHVTPSSSRAGITDERSGSSRPESYGGCRGNSIFVGFGNFTLN